MRAKNKWEVKHEVEANVQKLNKRETTPTSSISGWEQLILWAWISGGAPLVKQESRPVLHLCSAGPAPARAKVQTPSQIMLADTRTASIKVGGQCTNLAI